MKWIRYDIHTTTKDADAIGEILSEAGIAGYEISDHVPLSQKEEKQMFTDIPADPGADDGFATLTFYTEDIENTNQTFYSTGSSLRDEQLREEPPKRLHSPEEWIEIIRTRILAMQEFLPIDLPEFEYCIQDDSLWKNKWKENFKPFYAADDILIKPTWETLPADVKPEDIVIEIDPGSAFGTGTHETTKLCLQILRKYITPESRILDAGCGSGILAIASLLCGAKSAFCLDIDPSAVNATLENAQKNHIARTRLQAIHANILNDSISIQKKCNGPFDISVANILADVIISLSSHIGDFMKPDGIFIASGILAEKADAVKDALLQNHFIIIEKKTLGEWVAFVAKKHPIQSAERPS